MSIVQRIILIILSSGLGLVLNGQFSPQHLPDAELFTIEEGLSQTRVNVNFIDSRGFLWVGTSDGLNRYDGYKFITFRHNPLDSASISNNYIRAIAEDRDGDLWIGTNAGLNRYNPHTGRFSHFDELWPDSVDLNNEIKSVYSGFGDNLWILTDDYLVRIHSDSLNISLYAIRSESRTSKAFDVNTCLIRDRNGDMWFGTDRGLYRFIPEKEKFIHYLRHVDDRFSLASNKVTSLYEDNNGELWIGTAGGLNKYDRLNNRFKNYNDPVESVRLEQSNAITSICGDINGKLWLAGTNGLIHFDKRTERMYYFRGVLISDIEREVNRLNTIVIDNSNILWIGGLQGLFKIDLKPKKFELFTSSAGSDPRLSHENVSAVIKENGFYLWVGFWSDGIDRIDLRTGMIDHFSLAENLGDTRIRSLALDSENRIWIGTASGIDIYLPEQDKIRPFEEIFSLIPENGLKERQIFDMLIGENGSIWVGTDYGIYEIDMKTSLIRHYNSIYTENQDYSIENVYCLLQTDDNIIWLGSEKGLLRFDPERQLFEKIKMKNEFSWLQMTPVYSLQKASGNKLWIGTSYGLSQYNHADSTYIHYSEDHGLANNFVYAILEDIESNIWISTNKGLTRFAPTSGTFQNFSREDGLQAYEFNRGASYASEDGELFFGGVSGLNSFYPDQISDNPVIPEVALTDCEVIDPSGITGIPIGKHTSLIKIRYNQSLIIRFSAMDFTYPRNNRYRYSLQELEKPDKWLNLEKQNSVTVSNLSSGEYIFKVMGSNNDGVWSQEAAKIRILVEAPFWNTRIAYITYIFLFLILFYLFIQYRTEALRKTNRALREQENASREIARQKELLSRRNKNIEDSLKYAHRIQSAILDTPKVFKKCLPNSFILHKPKDIVSGDFYWIFENGNRIYVAAADCTGHGVPGAFMSIIGFELFRKLIILQKHDDPGEILDSLNKNFEEIFGLDKDVTLRDGMDLTFCIFDKKKMSLQFAGAFNPLYLIRDNKLTEVKGDRMSIGADNDPGPQDNDKKKFTSHYIELNKNDMIYLFSDGYADQFGGPEGKKFKYRRFRHLLLTIHQLPLDRQRKFLDDSMEEWRGEYDQIDDILVIGIRANFN